MAREGEFDQRTKETALVRQCFRCAMCGENISHLGDSARASHEYGESAQAHHRRPIHMGGADAISNCVVICDSCHYSAHGGGDYRHFKVVGRISDYPYFTG